MRHARRLVPILLILAAAFFVVHHYGWPWERAFPIRGDNVAAGDHRPDHAVSVSTLPSYTREAVGTAWFRHYFTRMAFGDKNGPRSYTGEVTKWTKSRVAIDIVNAGGPGMTRYVEKLVGTLNKIESATRFVMVNGPAEITITFLSHKDFRRTGVDKHSVGDCSTEYSNGGGGLIYAHIIVDAGVLRTQPQRRSTVIHELTHALGFNGHFRDAGYQQRSVLYYIGTITNWSQSDAAAIRVMYSSSIRHGMSVDDVEKALRRMGR